ncbi:hypothetical protein [Neolewinella persica]|uniref:hypothetical protein n=1 Tax=Neolewinella persica TaxID=70998 RepID=UPI00037BA5B7|nr:hypothetical protein [Neolewinella persica]
MHNFIFTFLVLILSSFSLLQAQFQIDAYSGNCYVRTGEGGLEPINRTYVRELPVYRGRGLERQQVKRIMVRNGFHQPAVYVQAKDGRNAIDVLRPEVKGEEIEYWIVKDTRLTEYYDWQTVQESWTDYEGKEIRAQWVRCSCQLPDERLQPVVNKLVEFGFLPNDFRFNGQSAESRQLLVVGINDYARSRNLEMLLEKVPHFVVVPLQMLKDLDLEFVKTKEWAFIRG